MLNQSIMDSLNPVYIQHNQECHPNDAEFAIVGTDKYQRCGNKWDLNPIQRIKAMAGDYMVWGGDSTLKCAIEWAKQWNTDATKQITHLIDEDGVVTQISKEQMALKF